MLDILQYIPGKRKQTASGWISFNAPCCIHNNNSSDHRMRGGLKINSDGWSYHCFNCNFTASFVLGRNLSLKARKLLAWMNVPQEEIERVNLESMKHRSIEGLIQDRQQVANAVTGIRFAESTMPPGAVFLNDTEHRDLIAYLNKRAAPIAYPFMTQKFAAGMSTSPAGTTSTRPHIIIPFTYDNIIVGNTIRFLDDRKPVWINDFQPGYVFGTDLQQPNWQYVIVTEGIFDALSISGLALMHNTVNDTQAKLIRNLGKEIIVVPDQDKPGLELIDRAIELGWSVSIPDWDGCKDVNDAVIKYGRLGTLLTIMQAKETSKIKIELRKRWLKKKLQL